MTDTLPRSRSRLQPFMAADQNIRGLIENLPTPRPIGEQLPAALQEDEFCQRMMAAFDEVIAPVFTTLDCIDTYLDPQLAPPDFVEWLASWVGVDIDETWTLERRRQLIQEAVVLYRIRGTAAGIAAHVGLYAGATPEIEDNGGCIWSETADTAFPGSPVPRLTVRLQVDAAEAIRQTTVARIVDASRPAHVPFQVEIVVGGRTIAGLQPEESGGADEAAPGAVALPGSERIELAPQGPETEEELEAEGGAEVAAGTEAESQPEAKAKPEPESKSGPEAKAKPEPKAKPKQEPGAETEAADDEREDTE